MRYMKKSNMKGRCVSTFDRTTRLQSSKVKIWNVVNIKRMTEANRRSRSNVTPQNSPQKVTSGSASSKHGFCPTKITQKTSPQKIMLRRKQIQKKVRIAAKKQAAKT